VNTKNKPYLCRIKANSMKVTFEKEYLRDLYKTGRAVDKKHRFQPEIIRKYQYCIDTLLGAKSIEVLYNIYSLNYEVLRGDKIGISSIRVSKQYRIEFTVKDNGIEPLVTICNILELSNHYK
jgi:proteic killer suppression protein